MRNEIFVNVGPRETRVAVRESDKIVELHIERSNERGVVGGIYKGRVTRVLPGMQAAFVDIGLERAGFLYVGDYRSELDDADLDDEERRRALARAVPARRPRSRTSCRRATRSSCRSPRSRSAPRVRASPRASRCPGGTWCSCRGSRGWACRAGSRATASAGGCARSSRSTGRRDLGFIVRTVSHGVSEADIKADIDYLTNLWTEIQKRKEGIREVPALIY